MGARGGLAEWGIVPPLHHPVTSSNTNTHKHIQIQIHIELQILVERGIISPQQHPVTYSNTKLLLLVVDVAYKLIFHNCCSIHLLPAVNYFILFNFFLQIA